VFKRESGVTVMQLISYPPAVESFVPELVGGKREIVLGKKSGRHSIEWKLKNLGITVPEEQVEPILGKVKALGESKKGLVSDEEFKSIVNEIRGK
jgi:isopropylmalate/homocitrate/citramalate synthase